MNNVIKVGSELRTQSDTLFLVFAVGKLIYKFVFNLHTEQRTEKSPQKCLHESCSNDLLHVSAAVIFHKPFKAFALVHHCKNDMKNPLSTLYNRLKKLFDARYVQQGRSVESQMFLVNNEPVCVNRVEIICLNSTNVMFHSLINKCLKLLFCNDIIDLIIEKTTLKNVLSPTLQSPEKISINETEEYFQKYDTIDFNFQSRFNNKSESLTYPTVVSSCVEIHKKKKPLDYTFEECESVARDQCPCQAAGDIEKDIKMIGLKSDDKGVSQISRIIKARKWVQSIKKQQIKNHFSQDIKVKEEINNIARIKPRRSTNTETKLSEKIKRQRFIVKKCSEKTEVKSSNPPTIVSAKLQFKQKCNKTRFTVLKQNRKRNDVSLASNSRKTSQNINNKFVKFRDPKCFSIIREDVLNLANEIEKHYVKHSRNLLSTSESINTNLSNIDGRQLIDEDDLLREIKKRLQTDKSSKNNDYLETHINQMISNESTTIATTSAMKLTPESKSKVSFKQTVSSTLLSSSHNPLNSLFQTATDATYKSIESNNSQVLESMDLRDIHQISDEIHSLAQLGMKQAL